MLECVKLEGGLFLWKFRSDHRTFTLGRHLRVPGRGCVTPKLRVARGERRKRPLTFLSFHPFLSNGFSLVASNIQQTAIFKFKSHLDLQVCST